MPYNPQISSRSGQYLGQGLSNGLSNGIQALAKYLEEENALDVSKLPKSDTPESGGVGGTLQGLADAGFGGRGFQNGMKLYGALSKGGAAAGAAGAAGSAAGAGAAAGGAGALSAL